MAWHSLGALGAFGGLIPYTLEVVASTAFNVLNIILTQSDWLMRRVCKLPLPFMSKIYVI